MRSPGEHIPIDPSARTLYEALKQLGPEADAEALVKAVKRLDLGLPAEDEFSVLLSWLGKCRLVHKLDQHQSPPASKALYRVPDLIAVFDHDGDQLAALVEVKATKRDSLSWRANYFEALQRYAQEVGLPLLVAWKWKPFGFWALFELRHFERPERNYKVTFETAMRQNLMGLLAGDFGLAFRGGVGLHIKMRKADKLHEQKDGKKLVTEWLVQVEDAYFTNGDGQRVDLLGPGLWPLLLSAPLQEQSHIEETHITQSFVVPAEDEGEWAHRAMVILLEFFQGDESHPLNWRKILLNQPLPIESSALRKGAQDGMSQGFVRYVLKLEPGTRPDFLP